MHTIYKHVLHYGFFFFNVVLMFLCSFDADAREMISPRIGHFLAVINTYGRVVFHMQTNQSKASIPLPSPLLGSSTLLHCHSTLLP